MQQYEVTFIVDPVLSGDEIEGTAKTYLDHLKGEGCEIVHEEHIGLRQLAYTISKRTTGIYYCVEFKSDSGTIVPKLELALRRDERIMRFLTVSLDKYGVKYNDDKRNGLIGKKRMPDEEPVKAKESDGKDAPKAAAKEAKAPAKEEAKAPVKEESKAPVEAEAEAPAKEETKVPTAAAVTTTATSEEE